MMIMQYDQFITHYKNVTIGYPLYLLLYFVWQINIWGKERIIINNKIRCADGTTIMYDWFITHYKDVTIGYHYHLGGKFSTDK